MLACACVHKHGHTNPHSLCVPFLLFSTPTSSPLTHNFSSTKSHYWEFQSQAEFSRILRLFYSVYFPLLLLVSTFILPFPFFFVFLADFYSEKLSLGCCGICILLLGKRQKKILCFVIYLIYLGKEEENVSRGSKGTNWNRKTAYLRHQLSRIYMGLCVFFPIITSYNTFYKNNQTRILYRILFENFKNGVLSIILRVVFFSWRVL